MMAIKAIFGAAAFGIVAALASGAVSPAMAGPSFPSAVEQILMHQQNGPVSKLPARRRSASCRLREPGARRSCRTARSASSPRRRATTRWRTASARW